MIQMPRRSVTRFFIPMIDVLTLLFCMFLLMPIIRENAVLDTGERDAAAGEMDREIEARKKELQELRDDQQRARFALAKLAAEKRDLIRQNVVIQLLHVSPKDGTLWFYDPVDSSRPPLKIDGEPAAMALIQMHKKQAGQRELLYIFQQPFNSASEVAPYPTRAQEAAYREWFSAVNFDGCVKPPAAKGAR